MTSSQHTSISIILTKILTLTSPMSAFIIGFISHWILDIQLYQEKKFNFTRINKQLKYLILEVTLILTMIIFFKQNKILMFAILGGLLPDIIDGTMSIINKQRYNRGHHLFPFHRPRKNQKELSTNKTISLSLILFLIVFIL